MPIVKLVAQNVTSLLLKCHLAAVTVTDIKKNVSALI